MLEELEAAELAVAADQGKNALQVNSRCQLSFSFDLRSFDIDNLKSNGTIDTEGRVRAEEAGVREGAERQDREGRPQATGGAGMVSLMKPSFHD